MLPNRLTAVIINDLPCMTWEQFVHLRDALAMSHREKRRRAERWRGVQTAEVKKELEPRFVGMMTRLPEVHYKPTIRRDTYNDRSVTLVTGPIGGRNLNNGRNVTLVTGQKKRNELCYGDNILPVNHENHVCDCHLDPLQRSDHWQPRLRTGPVLMREPDQQQQYNGWKI